jgi:hypothetical protein
MYTLRSWHDDVSFMCVYMRACIHTSCVCVFVCVCVCVRVCISFASSHYAEIDWMCIREKRRYTHTHTHHSQMLLLQPSNSPTPWINIHCFVYAMQQPSYVGISSHTVPNNSTQALALPFLCHLVSRHKSRMPATMPHLRYLSVFIMLQTSRV